MRLGVIFLYYRIAISSKSYKALQISLNLYQTKVPIWKMIGKISKINMVYIVYSWEFMLLKFRLRGLHKKSVCLCFYRYCSWAFLFNKLYMSNLWRFPKIWSQKPKKLVHWFWFYSIGFLWDMWFFSWVRKYDIFFIIEVPIF